MFPLRILIGGIFHPGIKTEIPIVFNLILHSFGLSVESSVQID